MLFSKNLVHDYFDIVSFHPINVNINGAIVREKLSQEDQALSHELQIVVPNTDIVVGFVVMYAGADGGSSRVSDPEDLVLGEWGIDVY